MSRIALRMHVLRAVLFAAITLAVSASGAAPAGPAPSAPVDPAALQTRMIANLAVGRIPAAAAGAESLSAAMRVRYREKPLAEAGFLDTLALRFMNAGTAEGWEAARKHASRALALREKTLGPDNLEVAATLSMIALVDDFEGRWAEALPLEQRSLAIRTRLHGELHPAVAASRRQIGLLLLQLGRYAEAEPMFKGALTIYDSLPGNNAQRIVDGLNNLAELSRARDRYGEAVAYFERALAVAEARLRPGDPWTGAVRSNLAGLYRDLGRYDDAEPLLVAYLNDLGRSPGADRERLAAGYLDLAEVYRLQDRLEESEPLYARALSMARAVFPAGSPDLVPFIDQAAIAYRALGHTERAEPLCRETLARTERTLGPDHPLVAHRLHDLGAVLVERGNMREAADTLGRALAIRTRALGDAHPDAAATRVELARALALDPARGDAAAAPLLDRALAVLDRTSADPEARLDAHALRAQIRARSGRMDEAIDDMSQALALVDTLRATQGGGGESRGSFTARNMGLYHQMVVWRVAKGDIEGALAAHERARARMLLDELTAASVDLRAGIPADVLAPLEQREGSERERLARVQHRIGEAHTRTDLAEGARLEAIAALEATRDSVEGELQRVQETLKERSPLWRDVLSARGGTASLAEIQHELLSPGELMLLYHAGGDRSFLFVIPAGDGRPTVQALTLDSAAVRELGVMREPGRPGSLERRLAALSPALMPAEVWEQVRQVPEVVVVPDGALSLVPFDALVMQAGTGHGDTRYWLDDGPPLRYGSSATSLLSLARRTGAQAQRVAARPQVLSVSNPDYSRAGPAPGDTAGTWPPLPVTTRETEAIRRAFAPDSIMVRAGAAATESRVRAALPGRRFIHIAAHGFVTRQQSDVVAGLVLTPPDSSAVRGDDDGYLQLDEIYQLPLDCDLAVLSACSSQGGGRVAEGGVPALSLGFMSAGARRVIASLWEVNDASTADLIGRLFAGIAGPARAGRDPGYPALLRDAKRKLRADPRRADPFYWAPFTLSGPH